MYRSGDELEFVKKELVVYQSKFAHAESEYQQLQRQLDDITTKNTKRTSELFDAINHLREENEKLKNGHSGTIQL